MLLWGRTPKEVRDETTQDEPQGLEVELSTWGQDEPEERDSEAATRRIPAVRLWHA